MASKVLYGLHTQCNAARPLDNIQVLLLDVTGRLTCDDANALGGLEAEDDTSGVDDVWWMVDVGLEVKKGHFRRKSRSSLLTCKRSA